jgi:DNA primase
LLPELARRAQLEAADLLALWGSAKQNNEAKAQRSAQAAVATGTTPGLQAPLGARLAGRAKPALRRASHKAPAASADLALRLLLRHSSWWQHLVPDDQALLHRLGGDHGTVVAWLEQQLMELGVQTWSALDNLMDGQAWQTQARQWANHGSADEVQSLEDLQRVLHRLWCAELREQVAALIAEGSTERITLDKIATLNERIRGHLQSEQGISSPASSEADNYRK